MKGHPITYSQEELAWLQTNCELVIAEYHAGFLAAFGRDDVGPDNLKSLRTRRGWKTGRTGCFPKGNVPVNKGQKYPPGKGGRHPNAVRTQFAKGQRSGIAARIYKPIGTERLSKEGYLERKVHDGLPMQSRWQTVQRINWEAVNGPVPDGMILKCLDGDRLNVDPSNWALLSRGTLPYMNGHRGLNYETAEPEVRPAIIAVAKVRHAVRNARRATP